MFKQFGESSSMSHLFAKGVYILFCGALLASSVFGRNSSTNVQHVTKPNVVAQLDAIVPVANWSVQPGGSSIDLNDDQITQIVLLASNQPLIGDIEVCDSEFLNVTGDSSYELLVTYGGSGRNFCNFVEIIRRTTAGYDVQVFNWYMSSVFQDQNGDGIPELGLTQNYSPYEGARGCQAQWTSWFQWNGSSYDKKNSSFPAWYQKRHDDLSAAIQTAQGQSGSGAGFDLDESCDMMERDRIERFLGINPKAGLDRALAWAASNSEQLQTRAVVVLANINDPTAFQALQTLAQSSNQNVAYDAQQALSSSSFSLALGATTIALAPGSQGSLALSETVKGGFADPISFSVAGLPAGLTARFSPTTLTSAGSTTLTLTVAPSALAGTYNPVIVAMDSANPSVARSLGFILTIPAIPTPTSTCQVTYTNTNDWGTGFSGSIAITNNASSALNGWTLAWGTNFAHQGVRASTTYYYVATAVNAAGESGPSNQASAVTGGASCLT